ncbi:MAG TPA: hypothetical protein VKK81_21795 [Candidatus Binatia bacterium]|nr:hypothetical protein [Candidatus Binatia bacterium]
MRFARLNERVLRFAATRGNVETELGAGGSEAGCGCGYPEWVDDSVVERSNAVMHRLRQTAAGFPALQAQLAALPMWQRIDVGATRVAVVHGDAESLAGWGFAQEALKEAAHLAQVRRWFAQAQVDIFASSHTNLPIFQPLPVHGQTKVIANNGAAGLPNFAGTQYGLLTRIATRAYEGANHCFGMRVGDVYIDALAIPYDQPTWERCFLDQWPEGSAAHTAYWARIRQGPNYPPTVAVPAVGRAR